MTKEEHAPNRVARETKLPPRSEEIVLVATNAKGLVQVGPLLERDCTKAWRRAVGIINEFLSRPFNLTVLNLTYSSLSLVKHERIATALLLLQLLYTTSVMSRLHTPPKPLIHESVNLVHYQRHVDRLQQMDNHEQVKHKDEKGAQKTGEANFDSRQAPNPQRRNPAASARI